VTGWELGLVAEEEAVMGCSGDHPVARLLSMYGDIWNTYSLSAALGSPAVLRQVLVTIMGMVCRCCLPLADT
jgi:hypothetical protein